jgi:hypothetical protein
MLIDVRGRRMIEQAMYFDKSIMTDVENISRIIYQTLAENVCHESIF